MPSRSSFALALAGALGAGLVAWGLAAPWQLLGWPLSVLPFNAASLLFLVACRTRLRDDRPKSVDFVPGTPEHNLAVFETRLRRGLTLAAPHAVAFSLPFQGEWICTQGVDGPLTHQGAWRHGFDFEIHDAGRSVHRFFGGEVQDYHCYALPVIAAADGTVVKVVSDVPDNAIGTVNVARNWGTSSCSGTRPASTPWWRTSSPAARRCARGRVWCAVRCWVPAAALAARRALTCTFSFKPPRSSAPRRCRAPSPSRSRATRREGWPSGARSPPLTSAGPTSRPTPIAWRPSIFRSDDRGTDQLEGAGARGWETISVEIDLFGETALASDKGRLAFRRTAQELLTTTCAAAPDSVLQLVRMALPSVSMGAAGRARWRDWLPSADWQGRRAVWRDSIAPFVPNQGIEMEYRLDRQAGGLLVIEGQTFSKAPGACPPFERGVVGTRRGDRSDRRGVGARPPFSATRSRPGAGSSEETK